MSDLNTSKSKRHQISLQQYHFSCLSDVNLAVFNFCKINRMKAWDDTKVYPTNDKEQSDADKNGIKYLEDQAPAVHSGNTIMTTMDVDSAPTVETKAKGNMIYEWIQTVYLTFNGDLPNSNICQALVFVFISNIFMSFVNSIAQTEPSLRFRPDSCSDPACNNDPDLCPGIMICAPVALPVYNLIDEICVYLFTFEYGVKLITYWAVDPSTEEEEEPEVKKEPDWLIVRYIKYILKFYNVVDLVCILPFYISFANGKTSQGAVFVRVFRILRVFKLIRYSKKPQQMFDLVSSTMNKSLPALGVLAMFLVLKMIFFGSIMYVLEQGTFTVNADYPEGQYLRVPHNGYGLEVSPFNSIPTSIYWVVTTGTTVGYGDLAPTSWLGRAVANIVMITGVLVLALPIGVVGSNFSQLYTERLQLDWKSASGVLDVDALDEAGMRDLFHHFDASGDGTISKKEFISAFKGAGVEGSDEFFASLFEKADDDGGGEICEDEFVSMCKAMQQARRGMSVAAASSDEAQGQGQGQDDGSAETTSMEAGSGKRNDAHSAKSIEQPPVNITTGSPRALKTAAAAMAEEMDAVAVSASQSPVHELKALRNRMSQFRRELDAMMNAIDATLESDREN